MCREFVCLFVFSILLDIYTDVKNSAKYIKENRNKTQYNAVKYKDDKPRWEDEAS